MKKTYLTPKARLINLDDQLLQVGSPGDIPTGNEGTNGNYAKRRGNDDFIYFFNEEDEYDDEYDF